MASGASAGNSLNVNPLIQAILQSALAGGGGGGDLTMGFEGLRGWDSPLAHPGGDNGDDPGAFDSGNQGPGGNRSHPTGGGGGGSLIPPAVGSTITPALSQNATRGILSGWNDNAWASLPNFGIGYD